MDFKINVSKTFENQAPAHLKSKIIMMTTKSAVLSIDPIHLDLLIHVS